MKYKSSLRLQNYNYSTPNAYFLTVCTKKRKNLFWTSSMPIEQSQQAIPLSQLGLIVKKYVEAIPLYYPSVSLAHYVIMPNHIHLLLQIHTDENGNIIGSTSIPTVMQKMKGAASKEAGFTLWQDGYHDHIVRGPQDYLDIWQYIENNPIKWMEDRFYQE